mgnify:CR=1 FL=1
MFELCECGRTEDSFLYYLPSIVIRSIGECKRSTHFVPNSAVEKEGEWVERFVGKVCLVRMKGWIDGERRREIDNSSCESK